MRIYATILLLVSIKIIGQTKYYALTKVKVDSINFSSQTIFSQFECSENFLKQNTGDSSATIANFKAGYDSLHLYVEFFVIDSTLEVNHTKHDSPIFKNDDCVEIFIDFDGDGKNYLELGVNPNGVYYDCLIICPTMKCGSWKSDLNFDLDTVLITSNKTKYTNKLKNLSQNLAYAIQITIPFKSLEAFKKYGFKQPEEGTIWKANFFNINPTNDSHSAWSPSKSFGFHQPIYFGELIFEK